MSETADSTIGDIARSWLREWMTHDKIDPTTLARRSNLPQPTVTRLLNGQVTKPSARVLSALATASPLAVPPSVQSLLDRTGNFTRNNDVKFTAGLDIDLPVWGVIPVETDGAFHLNHVHIAVLRKPAGLIGTRRIISFYAPDETMAPRWQAGEVVVADMLRPATVGGYALVRLTPAHDPNAEEVYLLRRYDGRTNGNLLLSKASDEHGSIRIPLIRVLEVRRVLDWSDMVG